MSDMSVGQWVGGIVGGVIGAIYGNVPGAIQGFAIGSGIGGVVDPPKGPTIKAPPDKQAEYQSSTYGAEKADLYGTVIVSGNVIYFENNKLRRTVTKKKSGGKGGGGGSSVEVVNYYGTWAVALGNARPGATLRRLWLGEKLLYDSSEASSFAPYYSPYNVLGSVIQSAKNGERFTFYDGTQTEPNARIAGGVGAANAESYEGTMYVIFYDIHMADYGNSLMGAGVRAEIVCDPVVEPDLIHSISVDCSPGVTFDPVIYKLGVNRSEAMLPNWQNDYPTVSSYATFVQEYTDPVLVSSADVDDGTWIPANGLTFSSGDQTKLSELWPEVVGIGSFALSSGYIQLRNSHKCGYYLDSVYRQTNLGLRSASPSAQTLGVAISENGVMYTINSANLIVWDEDLVNQVLVIPHEISSGHMAQGYVRMWVADGLLYVGLGENNQLQLSRFHVYSAIDLKKLRSFTMDPAFVGFGYAEFTIDQGILCRAYYSTGTSRIYFEKWQIAGVESGGESLSFVVRSICERAGISSVEVNTLDLVSDIVHGFASSGGTRGALGTLQAAYLFDIVENGYGLRCVKRSDNPTLVIPESDLGAAEYGDYQQSRIDLDREMDYQLPRKLTLKFRDYDREQNLGTAEAEYPVQSALEEVVDFPLVMDQEQGNKVVDILMRARHTERAGLSFKLPQKYLGLKPADVVTVQGPDRSYNVRIAARSESRGQIIAIEGRLSAPSLWSSDAVADVPTYVPPIVGAITDADFIGLDIPMMFIEQDTYGFVYGMSGRLNWPGGTLFRSGDGGQTYTALSGVPASSTVARAVNILSADEALVFDLNSQLIVQLLAGELSSVTIDQMMTGDNFAAYGADGRWEIISFADADIRDDGLYELSTLARGMYGTEWATGLHEPDDVLVVLEGDFTPFIAVGADRLGAEMTYRAVTFGQEFEDADDENFTYLGENLRPYSPKINPYTAQAGGIKFSVSSRTRYPSSFWYSGVQPINEPTVKFEADVYNEMKEVVRTLYSNDGNFDYTNEQQIEDFGEELSVTTLAVFQISDRVGRGHGTESTFESVKFTPYNINTELWLDAADAGTVTLISGRVSQWADKSGKNRHATQGTTSLRPTHDAVTRAVVFDGSRGLVTPNFHMNEGAFFFVSEKTGESATNQHICRRGGPEWTNIWAYTTAGNIALNMAGSEGTDPYAAPTDGSLSLYAVRYDLAANESERRIDGDSVHLTTTVGVLGGQSVGWGIGCSNSNTGVANFLFGSIREMIFVPDPTGVGNIQKIEGYLAWKWGLVDKLPVDHPYKYEIPTG